MIGLIAATVLLAAGLAAEDDLPAPEDQWVCSAEVGSGTQSSVSVGLQVTASGEVVATYVGWSPPMETPITRPIKPMPELTFFFDQAGADGMGPITSALATVGSIDRRRDSLTGKRWSVTVDGAGPWSAVVTKDPMFPDYETNGVAFRTRTAYIAEDNGVSRTNPEMLTALAGAAKARIEFLDSRGRVLAFTQYDLTATAARDQAFAAAWAQAEDRTHHLEQCELANGTPPPGFATPVP